MVTLRLPASSVLSPLRLVKMDKGPRMLSRNAFLVEVLIITLGHPWEGSTFPFHDFRLTKPCSACFFSQSRFGNSFKIMGTSTRLVSRKLSQFENEVVILGEKQPRRSDPQTQKYSKTGPFEAFLYDSV